MMATGNIASLLDLASFQASRPTVQSVVRCACGGTSFQAFLHPDGYLRLVCLAGEHVSFDVAIGPRPAGN